MCSSTANSSSLVLAWPLLLCFPVGWALRTLEPSAAGPAPVIRDERSPSRVVPAVWPALAQGLRPVMAGACWLRANLAWEDRDEAATHFWIELTVATDERPAYFWLNGARMIAYDMPGWMPGPDNGRNEAFAQRALQLLAKGIRWRGGDAALLIEMGNVHLRRRGDWEQAARYYRLAAERPGAPYYAARIHAELLLALGRPHEALAWLRRVFPGLPEHDPAARRAVVAARIRALEEMTRR
jgi:hypothetical protein